MSASVMSYQPPVQFNTGAQVNQNPTQNVQTFQMMAQILAEIAQLLQSSQQSNPAAGQQPATGQQPTFGQQPATGGAPAAPAPAAGATPGAAGGAGGQSMNAQSAAGALASYASANNISTMDPNALYKLAYNPPANATPTDSAAAKFMLQNPDVYNKIETHDVSGSDGVTGQGNLQWAAQGGLGTTGGATGGTGGAPAGGTGGASGGLGALSSLIASLENSLGMGGNTATPSTGGFGTGSTGGAVAPQTAATGGGASQMTGQSAAGALSSYASANNISTMDPNELYKLAYNPPSNATPTDSAAAKFMLQNPDIYNKIETHDVSGSDGVTGQGNLQWAAQGGLGAAGNTTGAAGGAPASTGGGSNALGALGGLLAQLEGSLGMGAANSTATPTAGGFGAGSGFGGGTGATPAPVSLPATGGSTGGATTGATTGASTMNTQSAAGALSAYMSANNDSTIDPNELYKLAEGQGNNETQTDQSAAQYMLQNPNQYEQIETHDVAGADGLSGQGNMQWAAQGGMNNQANPT